MAALDPHAYRREPGVVAARELGTGAPSRVTAARDTMTGPVPLSRFQRRGRGERIILGQGRPGAGVGGDGLWRGAKSIWAPSPTNSAF